MCSTVMEYSSINGMIYAFNYTYLASNRVISNNRYFKLMKITKSICDHIVMFIQL